MFGQFDLEIPASVDDALEALATGAPGAVLAGGTNLMIDLRARKERPERVIAIGDIAALRGITVSGERISLGSGTTISDLLASPEVAAFGPSLVAAAEVFAGQMVRNSGTVGGNIACGSPAADLVPPLMSLDAVVTLTSRKGARDVPLSEYFTGYKSDVRAPDELITRISWDRLPENSQNLFYKLARRKGDAITVTGVAVSLVATGGTCARARIALGAVAPTVIRARKAEAMLEGQAITPELAGAAARQAVAETSPIADVRASAEYRRHTVEMLTRRLVSQAWEKLI